MKRKLISIIGLFLALLYFIALGVSENKSLKKENAQLKDSLIIAKEQLQSQQDALERGGL